MLYIVPTPIGNLGDITYRAVEILSSVDIILAEDTRMTKRLLDKYNITTPLKSYHAFNEHQATANILDLLKEGKKIAVLCIDPSSPFNLGAVLGDRIRMSKWYTHPDVFIRSLATRGSMGGLSPKIIEITDLIKSANFDHIIVETVGVGQSEIEIAGLADITVVVVVPESGDEVQTMKAGLMEIADIFVINKSDRPDADLFERNLKLMLAPSFTKNTKEVPIIKTIATEQKGIHELNEAIKNNLPRNEERRLSLLTEKAWQLLIRKKMKGVDKMRLRQSIETEINSDNFNLYSFIENYI